MVAIAAIARTVGSPSANVAATARAAPDLEAQMRSCRAQLADWVTCPSAKTPEGKAKIEQVTAKLDSIKEQINRSANPSPAAPVDSLARPAPGGAGPVDGTGRLGSRLDTYA